MIKNPNRSKTGLKLALLAWRWRCEARYGHSNKRYDAKEQRHRHRIAAHS